MISDPANGEPPTTPVESRQLVLWLPDFFDPFEDSPAGAVLEGTLFQFEQNHPGLSIDIQIKTEYGQTGLLNYLRAAQRVAPSIMPDVVLVHSSQLWQIADLGIIPPLAPAERPVIPDYYPFGLRAVTYREQVYGYPYAANVVHGVIEREPSAPGAVRWDDILADEVQYVFPAGGTESFRLASAVMHYLAAGGTLEEEGAQAANVDALETFFEFLVLARQSGLIPAWVLEHASYESLWAANPPQADTVTLTTAHEFLHEGDSARFIYLPVPATGSQNVTIGNVWAFAVLTREENMRDLSLELVQYMLAPEIQGAWSQAALRLPTQPEALERWVGQNEYYTFLGSQLQVAQALPTGRAFADFARRLHNAQAGILRGELSVDQAIIETRTIE